MQTVRKLFNIIIGLFIGLLLLYFGYLFLQTQPLAPTASAPTATPAGFVTRTMFGDAWPLKLSTGRMACTSEGYVVFVGENDTTYAVNGTARGSKKFTDIAEIWLDNPSAASGGKVDLRPLLDIGLALCN